MHDPFARDARGRTRLFDAVEAGDLPRVRSILFALTGTGVSCQRLALIDVRDHAGSTALDVAEAKGHDAIADLLRSEKLRMEYFE